MIGGLGFRVLGLSSKVRYIVTAAAGCVKADEREGEKEGEGEREREREREKERERERESERGAQG